MSRSGPATDRERVLLLECRLEQMRAALDAAREEADEARRKLAEAAAREAGHARRFALIHEELADTRAEIAALHRHLERSESLREELSGHLFEGGRREDALELIRLRQKVLVEDQRAAFADRTVDRLRTRVEELVSSREVLLTRIAEWQQLIRKGEPGAADLSEFLAELRREILDLEHHAATGDAREAVLRRRLAAAGIDPDGDAGGSAVPVEPEAEDGEGVVTVATGAHEPDPAPESVADTSGAAYGGSPADSSGEAFEEAAPATVGDEPSAASAQEPEAIETRSAPSPADLPDPFLARPAGVRGRSDDLVDELSATRVPAIQADVLLRLGRSGDVDAVDVVRSWTDAPEPSVRAAAYEALGRLLERSPEALVPYVRDGLADPDARVRRRVVLAAATARGLAAHTLLDPLREDPDPQVRRVVRQVLRQSHAPEGERDAPAGIAETDQLETRSPRPLATRPSRTAS